jgi:holo-[acyl-carrier protein] synthase
MITGVGIDIVHIPRLERITKRWNNRFLHRIFTREELAYVRKKSRPAMSLAGFFAAKEATVKAIGTGFSQGITFLEIYVKHDNRGRPMISISGKALEAASASGASQWHLSISHDAEYAVATVIMEG